MSQTNETQPLDDSSSVPDPAPAAREVPQKLNYLSGQKLGWIGRHRKHLISLAILIAVTVPLYRYWQPLRDCVLWIYWSRQAAAHVMPTKAMDAWIGDPTKVATIPTTNPDYFTSPQGMLVPAGAKPSPVAYYLPQAYQRLVQLDSRLVMTGGISTPVIFMGTLKRPDQTPRLVLITGGSGVDRQLLAMTSVLVLPIPRLLNPIPQGLLPWRGSGLAYNGPPPIPTQMRTGVIDPADPSHVILEFTNGGPLEILAMSTTYSSAGGIIDAYLKNDDTLVFNLRSGGSANNFSLGNNRP